jgi:hypothetical protein
MAIPWVAVQRPKFREYHNTFLPRPRAGVNSVFDL